ncbi:MAG: hypothetical protein H8M99_06180 [Gloeobacteraceae cyanobacterium ES-bin-144]|nr:hypothetical protein [Verrucomicrobiales bacterium]
MKSSPLKVVGYGLVLSTTVALAQVDPMHRNLLQLGYDQPITGQGPQGVYVYYYYNNPEFLRTNLALRLALAPAYLDSELGFKQVFTPNTDVGIGIYGGAYGDNYYEVRQGRYIKGESFDGHGGGAALSLYQLLDPGMLIPLSVVVRGGFRYSAYSDNDRTLDSFTLPTDRTSGFVRTGLRFAGKEPVLYPDLGLEVSVWFERQWRSNTDDYGFAGDRQVSPKTDLFWTYAGLNYAFTNIGHQFSFAFTAGGSTGADRFSAWRLGGVLPLISEFPLVLPGYYYQELTAKRFMHFYAGYVIPLDPSHRFQLRLESAAARLDYLPGFEQPDDWQMGAGCGLTFTPNNDVCRIILRYGYGFNALRNDGKEGAHSVGLLFQYDFEAHKKHRANKVKKG